MFGYNTIGSIHSVILSRTSDFSEQISAYQERVCENLFIDYFIPDDTVTLNLCIVVHILVKLKFFARLQTIGCFELKSAIDKGMKEIL
jgi:hypothetical protein